jgi:stage V sporulation protein SpoVS
MSEDNGKDIVGKTSEAINENEAVEVITDLKVKADAPDLPADERKRNVKKLAGAISHSLRASGEINVRSFGSASIGKAAKALAIARSYVNVQNLDLACSPGFIETQMGDNMLTGICFCTFVSEKPVEKRNIRDDEIIGKCKSVLMVKADAKDIEAEERKINVKKLAGAITHSIEENKEVVIRCFGNATIGKASKAMAIARGHVANGGGDLYVWPSFIMADMNGNERTGIAFYCFTNKS